VQHGNSGAIAGGRGHSAKSRASSGVRPRRGRETRIRRISLIGRCLTTAMSHGDSRTTASMVGLKMETARRRGVRRFRTRPSRRRGRPPRGRPPGRPSEDDEVRLELDRGLHDPLRRTPPDPDHGRPASPPVHSRAPSGASRRRLARLRGAPGEAASPRGPPRSEGGQLPERGSRSAAPMRISSSAVAGFATGIEDPARQRAAGGSSGGLAGANARGWRRVGPRRAPAPRHSSARRDTACEARRRAPGAPRAPPRRPGPGGGPRRSGSRPARSRAARAPRRAFSSGRTRVWAATTRS